MTRGDDPSLDSAILLGVGAVHGVLPAEDQTPREAGRLWVPDPEQRRGWRERYIYPEAKPGEQRRALGFGKPGA